jgi:hypothetical protein
MMAFGLTISGFGQIARRILRRLLLEFFADEGDAVDSSERRHHDEVELDQNGVLLYALHQYVLWTGDRDIIRDSWDKIRTVAEFPLQPIFRHSPSGLVANQREYWERHQFHGIQKGMELAHQLFVSLGLSSAAALARMTGKRKEAVLWKKEAKRLKQAVLYDGHYGLVEGGRFIKRRSVDGSVQECIQALSEARLPSEVPLSGSGDHYLNPDTSTVLPIALGFVPPDSTIALNTMAAVETLWNQSWEGGGYGRYHINSEPDSPGSWPFPSLFVARAYAEMGQGSKVWRILDWLGSLPQAISGSWFEFYGERLAPPFPQVGIPPWTWAEMLILLIHHIMGIQPQPDHLRLCPRWLPGLNRVQASFPLRNTRLLLDIHKDPGQKSLRIHSSTPVLRISDRAALVGYDKAEMRMEMSLPEM